MKEKYAELLLKRCVNVKEEEPLFISISTENYEFARILNKKALEMGVRDIYINFRDEVISHDTLSVLTEEEIKNNHIWNNPKWDEYASKNAAFLMLESDDPDLMNDINPNKISLSSLVSRSSKKVYKEKQGKYEVSWCIAAIPSYNWAKKLFKDSNNPVDDLWNLIYEICFINKENPIEEWEKIVENSIDRCSILNKYKFKKLHYKNNLGTDLYVGLTPKTVWLGAGEKHVDGRKLLVNVPTFEVFTSPDRTKTNGIVYNSKPLVYNGSIIDNFYIEFKDGKVVNYHAEKGNDVLRGIINGDENSCMLGECALVDYNSPISNCGKVFYTTLYDENASCHLALGEGFLDTVDDYENLNKEELEKLGLNNSLMHVDFMIGTSDLTITGIDQNDNEMTIFENGNFVLE